MTEREEEPDAKRPPPRLHQLARRRIDRGDVVVDVVALPESVIVVTGDRGKLASGAPAPQSALWRSIFHARIHQKLDELYAAGALGAATFRERVHRLGQTEFDGIRWVLRQEAMLLPPADTPTTSICVRGTPLSLYSWTGATSGIQAIGDTDHSRNPRISFSPPM